MLNLNVFVKKSIFISFIFLTILNSYNCTNEENTNNPLPQPQQKIEPTIPKPEYTEEEAGEWEEIKGGHVPIIKIDFKSKKDNINIKINGEFNEQHYIERIGIMDENKQDLAGESLKKKFDPEVTLSLEKIPDNPKVKVYAKCNLHDLWTKPLLPSKEN